MYLDIPLFGTVLTYNFEFLPLAREQLDILESLLRDAQDEINDLRKQLVAATITPVISLRSSTACANGSYVTWNAPEVNTRTDIFEQSADRTTITVNVAGVYQICARLTAPDSSGARRMDINVNGSRVAHVHSGHNTGYQNTAVINDVVNLAAGSRVQVYHNSGNANTNADPLTSEFSIIKLA